VRILGWLLGHVVALAVATWLLEGIRFTGPTHGAAEIRHKLLPLVAVAVILGLVSMLVKPILTVLSIPFIVVTLGLFLLAINAAMLLLTGWLAGRLGLGFEVAGFWPAVGGAIIITIVGWFMRRLVDDR
jgi:putative membrane protein